MFERLTPAEWLRRGASGGLRQLVDVREPWELEIASVEKTINIPMGEIPSRYNELDAARPVAIMCHSGGRSARVAGFLAENGFKAVANIEGGIDAWSHDIDPSIPRY